LFYKITFKTKIKNLEPAPKDSYSALDVLKKERLALTTSVALCFILKRNDIFLDISQSQMNSDIFNME
jgi:hypothetical protein